MIDQTLHDKIEKYLLGKMPPEEARVFETEIQNDPDLAEEVELHRLILPVPDRLAEMDLQQDFARWRQELEPDPPMAQPAPRQNPFQIWLALTMLLLLAGVFWLWRHYETQLAQERSARIELEKTLEAEKLRLETCGQENRQLREDMLEFQRATSNVTPPVPGRAGGNDPIVVAPQKPEKEPEYVALADQELIAYADEMIESLRGRGIRSGASGEELVDKADTAILNKKYREATKLLALVKAGDPMYPKSLEMRAYVYFKRKMYPQAVAAYRKYRVFDGNTDKTDWDLCLFYLADYPRYRLDFQQLLVTITKDDKHPRQADALTLRDKLAQKMIWPK